MDPRLLARLRRFGQLRISRRHILAGHFLQHNSVARLLCLQKFALFAEQQADLFADRLCVAAYHNEFAIDVGQQIMSIVVAEGGAHDAK